MDEQRNIVTSDINFDIKYLKRGSFAVQLVS